jgi:hypothetical protein
VNAEAMTNRDPMLSLAPLAKHVASVLGHALVQSSRPQHQRRMVLAMLTQILEGRSMLALCDEQNRPVRVTLTDEDLVIQCSCGCVVRIAC